MRYETVIDKIPFPAFAWIAIATLFASIGSWMIVFGDKNLTFAGLILFFFSLSLMMRIVPPRRSEDDV